MQEAEEQDTCRICSAPGEPGQPLFYPCKCSGTIRYTHQDCLTTWLSHSKKKTCDVCKHPYSFTKVYASDMPSSLPPLLLVRRLAQQAFFASLFGVRAILIAIVWLALLPWITIWTWRVYFTMGESTAWWISGRERTADFGHLALVRTLTVGNETVSSLRNATILHRVTSREFWQTLSSDIFAGQIIASLIVLIFVAAFLLREWISQNARPGVFEEDEIPLAPNPALPPINFAPIVQPMPNVNPLPFVPPRHDPLDDVEPPRIRQARLWRPRAIPGPRFERRFDDGNLDRVEHFREPIRRPFNRHVEPLFVPQLPLAPVPTPVDLDALPADSSKGKEREDEFGSDIRRRVRRRFYDEHDGDEDEDDESRGEGSSHLRQGGPASSFAPSTIPILEPVAGRSTAVESAPFEFTFRVPPNGHPEDEVREPVPDEPAQSWETVQEAMMTGSPIPVEEPRRRSIVFTPDFPPVALPPRAATPSFTDESSHRPLHDSSSRTSGDFSFTQLSTSGFSQVAESSLGSSAFSHAASSAQFTSQESFTLPSEASTMELSSATDAHSESKKRMREETEEEYQFYFRDPPSAARDTEDDRTEALEATGEHAFYGPVAEAREQPTPEVVFDSDESDDDDAAEPMFWNMDPDREDEEDDDDDMVDIAEIVNIPDRPVQAPPQPQPPAEQANDVVDDLEAGVEDDMEGALEAIGLRGPVFSVVQNVILMIFVLDTAIGLGVWLPFTLGKTTALLTLDPQRALYILHLPIRGVRCVTDPAVDIFTFALSRFLFPPAYQASKFFLSRVLSVIGYFTGSPVDPSAVSHSQDVTSWIASKKSELITMASAWLRSTSQERPSQLWEGINAIFQSDSSSARLLEPHFASIGREVRLFADRFQQTWVRLALGHGNSERAFAIALGYTVVGIILALYLNVFTVGNAKTAGKAVRNAIRQQLLVVKVAMFIIVELIVFPLGCGVMLDACTIWVFPEASIESRMAFFTEAPLTAMFYHWVAGTMFMYQFAVLLGGCRNIMRPGAMWFIKDPQDQNFHPIRDILERPTFTQFRKLLISAFMYAMVVACGVGSLAILLFVGNRSIFPIRWRTREPLSEVPIDLLFLQIVLPYTMRYLRPRKTVYRASTYVWKLLAARLRLTSYMFGDRIRDEESSKVYKSWFAFFRRSAKDKEEMVAIRDGSYRRVPASDNIALPRDMRATAEVFEDGTAYNPRAAALMATQNAEAVKAKRSIKDDYIVVYFAPRFRMRIIAFVMAVWTIMAIVAAFCIAVPVQIGRHFFALISLPLVHDGYSFLAGFYILWACYLVAKAAQSMDRRRQRITGDGPRAEFAVYFAKQSLLWAVKILYMGTFLGVIIPILIGLVVDLYIVLPVRLTIHPTMVPTIRLVDMWSLGLVYCKIVIRLRRRLQLPRRQHEALHVLLFNGWTQPNAMHATKEIILPLLAILFSMLLFPAGVVYLVQEFIQVPLSKKFLFVHVYPGIFALAGLSRLVVSALSVLSSWSQSIRDKEFLVEMRLQNLELDEAEQKKAERGKAEQKKAEHETVSRAGTDHRVDQAVVAGGDEGIHL